MSVVVLIVVGMAVLLALYAVDLWLGRLVIRVLLKLVDLLPPYRPSRRYCSRSEPEKYASLSGNRDVR